MEADRCADSTRRANHQYLHIIIVCDKREAFAQGRALATKQSFSMRKERMDCFAESSSGGAEPVIERAFARPVGADPLARNDGAGQPYFNGECGAGSMMVECISSRNPGPLPRNACHSGSFIALPRASARAFRSG